MPRVATSKAKVKFEESFAFWEELRTFYLRNRKQIRGRYKNLTKQFLDYNDREKRPEAFLRPPQFEALEMYVFVKEFLGNEPVAAIFDEWRNREGVFSERSAYSATRTSGGEAPTLMDDFTEKQTDKLLASMEKYREAYPNYIFALTMGLGKTVLIATCIFYEFLHAKKYPKDPRFVHNALVFAPDKTVLESLREIVEFNKAKVVPEQYVPQLETNIRFHFLDDTGTTLNALDDSDYNVVISNTQKIIVKRKKKAERPAETLFSAGSLLAGFREGRDEEDSLNAKNLTENQRFQRLTRLKGLGVYVDEAHHLFGAQLEKGLREGSSETSLRATINRLAAKTSLVGCFNYTGTPYVKRKPLPEVVYAYGLRDSINKGYLKSARLRKYDNVKDDGFLREVLVDFWASYGGHEYEGLTPKLAIFAATVEEAVETVRPAVERVLTDLGVNTSIVLVNVGDQKYTKDRDIQLFNQLDVPGSEGNRKQIIILVGKGREGWNCRSLFGVAMFRSPKSKVFVLQATMRCLRSITEEQQEATVYLSAQNYEILDDEMEQNFHMDVDGLTRTEGPEKVAYKVRVMPPERTIALKQSRRSYRLATKDWQDEPIHFGLPADEELADRYAARVTEKRLTADGVGTVSEVEGVPSRQYSLYMLAGELARFLAGAGAGDPQAPGAVAILRMLEGSVEGPQRVLEAVNRYNEVIDDYLVPALFRAAYDVEPVEKFEEREVVLLRKPDGKEFYLFHARPELVATMNPSKTGRDFTQGEIDKSFHADTYCFDSKPELELFKQYLASEEVDAVYFTGMFTSGQSELAIPWYDPESQSLRNYYPDFVAEMADGKVQLIEVKGAHKLDSPDVLAKAEAARALTDGQSIEYIMYSDADINAGSVFGRESPRFEAERLPDL